MLEILFSIDATLRLLLVYCVLSMTAMTVLLFLIWLQIKRVNNKEDEKTETKRNSTDKRSP